MTEDEMVGWHHQLSGHEFKQTLGDGRGQGSLACCSPRGCRQSDTTDGLRLNTADTADAAGQAGGVAETGTRTEAARLSSSVPNPAWGPALGQVWIHRR